MDFNTGAQREPPLYTACRSRGALRFLRRSTTAGMPCPACSSSSPGMGAFSIPSMWKRWTSAAKIQNRKRILNKWSYGTDVARSSWRFSRFAFKFSSIYTWPSTPICCLTKVAGFVFFSLEQLQWFPAVSGGFLDPATRVSKLGSGLRGSKRGNGMYAGHKVEPEGIRAPNPPPPFFFLFRWLGVLG